MLDVDSIAYLSIDGLYRAMGHKDGRDPQSPSYTDHCFTGDYPTTLMDQSGEENIRQLSLLFETILADPAVSIPDNGLILFFDKNFLHCPNKTV